jgi:hypothetical protein
MNGNAKITRLHSLDDIGKVSVSTQPKNEERNLLKKQRSLMKTHSTLEQPIYYFTDRWTKNIYFNILVTHYSFIVVTIHS